MTVEQSKLLLRLESIPRRNSLGTVLAFGDLLLDEVFDGDMLAVREGRGSTTLREVARSGRLGLSASTLYRYVAVADLCRRLGRRSFMHLGVSHLRQVLPLPTEQQETLIERAERERWTVQKLKAEVQRRRHEGGGPRRGRRPRSGCRDALQHLRAWAGHEGRLEGLDELARLQREEARGILRMIRLARMDLEIIESRLEVVRER